MLPPTATGFPLVIPPDVGETPAPSDEQLQVIRDVLDPDNLRDKELGG